MAFLRNPYPKIKLFIYFSFLFVCFSPNYLFFYAAAPIGGEVLKKGAIFWPFVRTCVPPLGHPARPEAQPARPEAQQARPETQPARTKVQPARFEA